MSSTLERLHRRYDDMVQRYYRLSTRGKAAIWAFVCLQWILLIVFIVLTPKRIFEGLAAWANNLRETTGGFFLLIGLIAITSFPPLFGFTTACTLCGFAYGLTKGFLVAFTGMILGATCSFLFARLFFSKYAHRMLEHSTFFKAFGTAISHRGVPLLCLLRLTPIPWAYANFSLATFKEISPVDFLIATCAYSPKLLLHVYVGTRLYLFSDPDHLNEMDGTTKWLNSLSIAASLLLGIGVGSYAYRLMAGYAASGHVTLADEEDLDRFLEEEEELERQEEAQTQGSQSQRTRDRSHSNSSLASDEDGHIQLYRSTRSPEG